MQQPKYDKNGPNKQSPENHSKPQEKKDHGKTKKDTRKWCDFHKNPLTQHQGMSLKTIIGGQDQRQGAEP